MGKKKKAKPQSQASVKPIVKPSTTPLRVFIGYDHRQAISYNVLQHSIVTRSSQPVQICPLIQPQLPLQRTGLTPFTYTRFLVPYLCQYQGWALFMDADMLLIDDIAKLFALRDDKYNMMLVKNPLRLEWPSMILFNCQRCTELTPEFIENTDNILELNWLEDANIGELPSHWNHTVGYDDEHPHRSLIHFTQGVPIFPELTHCEYSDAWFAAHEVMQSHQSWLSMMGTSVHATDLDGKRVPRLVAKQAMQSTLQRCNRSNPSNKYQQAIEYHTNLHQQQQYCTGMDSLKQIAQLKSFTQQYQVRRLLDYGSGKGLQYQPMDIKTPEGQQFNSITEFIGLDDITCYDPAYQPYHEIPQGKYDGVICLNVLEYCPEEDINWIVDELFRYAKISVLMKINCKPATSDDDSLIHQHDKQWWHNKIAAIAQGYPTIRCHTVFDNTHSC